MAANQGQQRQLANYGRPQVSASDFVAKRLEAHAAGTRDLDRDPLVKAALAERRAAQEVMSRWNSPIWPVSTRKYGKLGRQAE